MNQQVALIQLYLLKICDKIKLKFKLMRTKFSSLKFSLLLHYFLSNIRYNNFPQKTDDHL